MLAARIERQFTKSQILEMYLNKVYFGDGLYGVEAASRGYFGKHANEVTIAEAALLAGLIQSPSSYAPTVNLDRAVARRNVVLGAMLANAVIAKPQFDQAKQAPVHLTNALEMKESFGLYFKEQVRRELVERFGTTRIAEVSGLRVYIDDRSGAAAGGRKNRRGRPRQHRASARLCARVARQGRRPRLPAGRARRARSRHRRGARARRRPRLQPEPLQPRDAGAPPVWIRHSSRLVYAAALEAGYSPASVISNLNAAVDTAGYAQVDAGGRPPSNADGDDHALGAEDFGATAPRSRC